MHVKIVATMTAAVTLTCVNSNDPSYFWTLYVFLCTWERLLQPAMGRHEQAGRQTLRRPSTWITSSTCEASLEAFYESAIVVHISCDVEMWRGIQPHDDTCQRFSELDDTYTLLQYIQAWSKWTKSTNATFQEQ